MKLSKCLAPLMLTSVVVLAGCAAPSRVQSSSASGITISGGSESGAKDQATLECRKWGKREAVLRQVLPGGVPWYVYDCK